MSGYYPAGVTGNERHFDQQEALSDCCWAEMTGDEIDPICTKCGEHCKERDVEPDD